MLQHIKNMTTHFPIPVLFFLSAHPVPVIVHCLTKLVRAIYFIGPFLGPSYSFYGLYYTRCFMNALARLLFPV